MSERGGLFRPFLVRGGSSRTGPAPVPDTAERFRTIMLPHLDAAYNLARWLATDPATAEDIVQETFLRAFRAFSGYQGGSPRAWLFAILRNCWRDRAGGDQERGRVIVNHASLTEAQAAAIEAVPDEAETADAALIRTEDSEALRATIAAIPEPFREALVLREMEQLPYREIAAITGVPIGTVMSRLARAREMLAKLLLPETPREERA
ncbi:MAG: sigma-70 family RNA polymerase sigma factor [Sphingomonas sp.]